MKNLDHVGQTKAELLAEIQILRDRLSISEETLRAIQTGEVDALVISTQDGPRIFTLQTADQSYRLLVEEMQQGAALLSTEGLILYCNQSLANLVQRPIENLVGAYLQQFLSLQDSFLFQSRMRATAQGQRSVMELFLISSNAVEIPIFMTISLITVDDTLMHCVVITDLTEQKRHEATRAAERLARLMLEQAGEAILVCDPDGMIIRASQVACELWGQTLLWQPFDALGIVPTASRGALEEALESRQIEGAETQAVFGIASVLKGDSIQGLEVELEAPRGQRLNLILSARPLADVDHQRLGAVVLLTDITERKQIETQRRQALAELGQAKAELEHRVAERTAELSQINASLQQSESTLRSFFDSAAMSMGIVEVQDQDIFHISDNGAAAQFFGSSPPAMVNRFSSDLGIPTETIQRWLAYYQEAERTQAPVHFEYRQGDVARGRWLAGSVCFIAIGPSGRSRFSYIIEDITERKQAEETLALSEEQLRLTLEFTHIGTWDWELQENTVTWNDNHFTLLGLDPNSTDDPYQCWRKAIHPDDLDRVEQALQDALHQHTDYEAEYRVLHTDGNLRWLVGRGRGIYNSDQAPIRMLGVIIDISERKQAEQRQEFQAVITRNMAEGICVVRADNGLIAYANHKFEHMFGYELGELNGQHVSIVNYATEAMSAEAVNQVIRQAVLENQEATYEVHNVKKDGTPFWCSATTSVFEHPEYGMVLVAVHQDISERKEAQEKIQASLQEKELLLKEIYHRVKNNLHVIYSLLSLQARNVSDPAVLTALRDSQSRVRAMALVHEKLYQAQNLSQIDLADYIQGLAYSLIETYHFSSNHITLKLEIESYSLDLERVLPCGLVLTELISNSLKYAFPDSRRGEISILLAVSDQQIVLRVADNGIGLPDDFELRRVSSLGLSLVQNLTKQLRGKIKIVPQSVGSAFEITFPK